MRPFDDMLWSSEAYVRHSPTNSSAAKLPDKQSSEPKKEDGHLLVVVIQELRWVVNEERSARDYTRRLAPELLRFTREDDPHILFCGFTARSAVRRIKRNRSWPHDLPSLDRFFIIPDLLPRTRHQSQ